MICSFSDVSEHDMDMLIFEELVCSEIFLHIFTDAIGLNNARLTVPILDLHQPFDCQVDKVKAGLDAVEKMSALARQLNFRDLVALIGS